MGGPVGVALGGILAGVLEWLVLRRHVTRAGWWVLASTVGWVVGGFVSGIVDTGVGWAILGAVYGPLLGRY